MIPRQGINLAVADAGDLPHDALHHALRVGECPGCVPENRAAGTALNVIARANDARFPNRLAHHLRCRALIRGQLVIERAADHDGGLRFVRRMRGERDFNEPFDGNAAVPSVAGIPCVQEELLAGFRKVGKGKFVQRGAH